MAQQPTRAIPLAKGVFDVSRLGVHPSPTTKYNGMLDPTGVEHVGRALAAKARTLNPNVVIIWEDIEDIPLAHVVARELSVAVIRAFDDDGLVDFTGTFPERTRALILTDLVRPGSALHAIEGLVIQRGGEVVGLAVIVEDREKSIEQSWPVVSLTVGPAADV